LSVAGYDEAAQMICVTWSAEKGSDMQGIRVFSSLREAEAAGFTFFERTPEAIVVRRSDGRVMALALVKLSS
jgi:hypothetical protein